MLRRLFAGFALCCAWAASAAVLNVEFKFTPYTGDPAGETVDSVAGTARVFLNEVPVIEQEVRRQTLPVMFEAREIGPAVWLPAASLGAGLRKGDNRLRIEFEPADAALAYAAQLRWAAVTDQVTEHSADGRYSATNQADEGVETKNGSGRLVFERTFGADFATDRPWHHYPPVSALDDADRAAIAALLKARADAFKPPFAGVYTLLQAREGIRVADVRKFKCLDKAYAAGVRVLAPTAKDIEFVTVGQPEVMLQRAGGHLFAPDPKPFERIRGSEMQFCAGVALAAAYPARLAVVRTPQGAWEVVY